MNKTTVLSATAIALVASALSFNLMAGNDKKMSAADLDKAAISLTQALGIAENATGGKSVEAEFEMEDGKAIYEVEVITKDGAEVEVEIDAQTGEVLSKEIEGEDDDHDDKDHS